jgi:hypothetical protein
VLKGRIARIGLVDRDEGTATRAVGLPVGIGRRGLKIGNGSLRIPPGLRFAGLTLAWAALSGCDLVLLSPSLPGLVPGVGQPIRGQVLDSATGQPIGAASVVTDIGWATTDNNGKFALYGAMSKHTISIGRAGYTSLTFATGAVQEDRAYFIDPLFPTPTSGELTSRRTEIVGNVVSNVSGVPVETGEVVFGGKGGTIRANRFAIPEITAGLPGSVYSGVLAAGEVAGGPIVPGPKEAEQPFNFRDYGNGLIGFGYSFVNVPFGPTGSLGVPQWTAPDAITIGKVFSAKASIGYSNTSWASEVKTAISLDFGILGSVPVARQLASHVDVIVPSVKGATYVLEGRAFSADRNKISLVVINTNGAPSENFDLLAPPEPIAPAKGGRAGGRPTFSWKSVPSANAYMVQVFEPNIPQPKWRGLTTDTSLPYPGFGDGDVNGGALLPGVKYSWEVHAISSRYGAAAPKGFFDFKDFVPTAFASTDFGRMPTPAETLGIKDGSPPFRPFRKRSYESITKGLEFER